MNTTEPATRILATLGPSSNDKDTIKNLVKAGANAFRLNFSHGTHQIHKNTYNHIRTIADELGVPLGILADLQGPKLRVGTVTPDTTLTKGDRFTFDLDDKIGDAQRVFLPHREIFEAILPGQRMLVDDGNMQFTVTAVDTNKIITRVDVGGTLTDRKGVNIPDVALALKPLTDKDKEDLDFALSLGVDWVALSFVQNVSDVIEARGIIKDRAALMVKIEKPQALDILDDLIRASDGIMIARGDLGVELPLQRVPRIQNEITTACRRIGKPVVVATQMLESMIHHHTPTRAEVSDVATAVASGVDCVMLSAETASGQYPVQVIEMMRRIILTTESGDEGDKLALESIDSHTTYHAVAASAAKMAIDIGATAIVGFSTTGTTVVRLSRERPNLPIVMITPKQAVRRRMSLTWGVTSIFAPPFDSFDDALDKISRLMLEYTACKPTDLIVVVAGTPFGVAGTTNTIRVLQLREK